MTLAILYWLSLAALLLTKAMDVLTTIRHVHPAAETNPFAQRLFARRGFTRGLVIVCAIFLLIAVGQYVAVWLWCAPWIQWSNAGLGFVIAWIQLDVARFNATTKPSKITRAALHCYTWWSRWWRR